MMPAYPGQLQVHPNFDYTETLIDGVVRTQPDIGPPQARPRYTRVRRTSTLTIWVDPTLYEVFMDFYENDLIQGSLPFDWLNPIKQTPASMQFTAPPKVQYVGPLTWAILCQLEEV